jgi:hypothetical protein
VHGDEALQISAVKKGRTRFLRERTELGDDPQSGRSANSYLAQVIAQLIRERPFFMQNMMQTSQGLERDMSRISLRETRAQQVSSSVHSAPSRPEQNLKVSKIAMSDQRLDLLQHCQATDFVNFLAADEWWFFLEYPHYGAL